jgi:hypothetical protein
MNLLKKKPVLIVGYSLSESDEDGFTTVTHSSALKDGW